MLLRAVVGIVLPRTHEFGRHPGDGRTMNRESKLRERILLDSTEGRSVSFGFLAARILIDGSDSGGSFGLVESPIEPRTLAGPIHVHRNEDGYWYVLEGEFAAQVGERVYQAGPGALIFAPKGVAHTYWNPGGEPARYLEFFSPAGLELYFEELDRLINGPTLDPTEIFSLAQQYGLELDLESIPRLMQEHSLAFPEL